VNLSHLTVTDCFGCAVGDGRKGKVEPARFAFDNKEVRQSASVPAGACKRDRKKTADHFPNFDNFLGLGKRGGEMRF